MAIMICLLIHLHSNCLYSMLTGTNSTHLMDNHNINYYLNEKNLLVLDRSFVAELTILLTWVIDQNIVT